MRAFGIPSVGAVILGLCAVASPARGQSPADIRKDADASVDRNLLLPSAETVRAGDLTFNSYELFLAGLTYGITDNLQISVSGLLPLFKDMPVVGTASAKYRVLALDRLIFSVQPTFSLVSHDGNRAGALGAQLLLDLVLDDEGDFVLGLAESTQWAWGSREGDLDVLDAAMVMIAGSFSARLAKNFKVLIELTLPGGYADGELRTLEEALLLSYGARFFGETVAVDLSFVRPIHPDVDSPLLLGIPLVTFSARF